MTSEEQLFTSSWEGHKAVFKQTEIHPLDKEKDCFRSVKPLWALPIFLEVEVQGQGDFQNMYGFHGGVI